MNSIKLLFTFLIILGHVPVLFAQTGSITGKITDKATGEELIGTTVKIEGTGKGAITDLNGSFTIENVPAGKVNLVVSYMAYATQIIEGAEVKPGRATVINIMMEEATLDLKEVVVEAKALKNTDGAILAMQKKAVNVQDGVSGEQMSKSGNSDAGDAVKQITGASVVDGKYIYVRGLGDRYSYAQLNGSTLSSTDPNSNSTQLDIIPTNLLDNIIATKTFTPDQPGNFTGGAVNLTTKSFPDRFTLNFSTSVSYNDQSSFNDQFLTHKGGKNDWLGYDDGTRAMPEIVKDPENRSQLRSSAYITARRNAEKAQLIHRASNAFSSQMAPHTTTSGLNSGVSFSMGNKYKLFKQPLGVLMGINYRRTLSHYSNAISANWDITGNGAEELFYGNNLRDTRSTENPQLNALLNLSYRITPKNEIGINYIYSHDAEKTSRYQEGDVARFSNAGLFQTRTLSFTERKLNTVQLRGKHSLSILKNAEVEWIGGYTRSSQDEPDLRFFANEKFNDSLYEIRRSEYDLPAHFFRYLVDDLYEAKADISIPLSEKNKSEKLKFGVFGNNKQRNFTEERFRYENREGERYNGNPEYYFSSANTGIVGYNHEKEQYTLGNFIIDDTQLSNSYTGTEQIIAAYGMVIKDFSKKLKFIGGVRAEHTFMEVISADPNEKQGKINTLDLLPSLNLVYALKDDQNIRLSTTRTIARPTMRELAPFYSFDFIGGFFYLGNPDLTRTIITNADLRYEWYVRPGELFAISGFYKHFQDPIGKVYNAEAYNPEVLFINTEEANVAGVELELRKRLDFITKSLSNFSFISNFSYVVSRVQVNQTEYEINSAINPEIKPYRPFQGQSPYLINVGLNYNSDSANFNATISFNRFGARLSEIGKVGVPDLYEQPRNTLNFNMSKGLGGHFILKAGVQNILNDDYRKVHTYKGKEFVAVAYTLGRTYSLGLSYNIK